MVKRSRPESEDSAHEDDGFSAGSTCTGAAPRRVYDAAFKLHVVRQALSLPENNRHKPIARLYPGLTPVSHTPEAPPRLPEIWPACDTLLPTLIACNCNQSSLLSSQVQVRKWIRNAAALEQAVPSAKVVLQHGAVPLQDYAPNAQAVSSHYSAAFREAGFQKSAAAPPMCHPPNWTTFSSARHQKLGALPTLPGSPVPQDSRAAPGSPVVTSQQLPPNPHLPYCGSYPYGYVPQSLPESPTLTSAHPYHSHMAVPAHRGSSLLLHNNPMHLAGAPAVAHSLPPTTSASPLADLAYLHTSVSLSASGHPPPVHTFPPVPVPVPPAAAMRYAPMPARPGSAESVEAARGETDTLTVSRQLTDTTDKGYDDDEPEPEVELRTAGAVGAAFTAPHTATAPAYKASREYEEDATQHFGDSYFKYKAALNLLNLGGAPAKVGQ